MTENEKDEHRKDTQDVGQRPSSTSPLEGKTHEATKPPGQGDLDRDAEEKSREGLDRAGGGH
ncbi:MAG TPA: hypothetical protein VEX36_12485 [Thermoleophilaceae bacterium]|nr:hypothetical protein [Thermoleophilaceae bacterium]